MREALSDETEFAEQLAQEVLPGREVKEDFVEKPVSAENVVAWAREARLEAED